MPSPMPVALRLLRVLRPRVPLLLLLVPLLLLLLVLLRGASPDGSGDAPDDSHQYGESGTKFMLDACAAGYMRARIHGREALLRMEAYADRTFDQRMLIYGHSSVDRNDAEFYLSTVRHLESDVELMGGISLAVEQYQSLGVWTTPQQQRRMNILFEFQKHLLPGEKGGALATSFKGGAVADKRQRRRQARQRRRRRHARRYLPVGRIPEMDQFVTEYMQTRATALTLQRQAQALVGFMSDGLPKRWAGLYLEIMESVEERGGLTQIAVLGGEWAFEADRLTEELLRRERASGQRQYSYGGEGDPDGRMLVLAAFERVPEWVRFVEDHYVSVYRVTSLQLGLQAGQTAAAAGGGAGEAGKHTSGGAVGRSGVGRGMGGGVGARGGAGDGGEAVVGGTGMSIDAADGATFIHQGNKEATGSASLLPSSVSGQGDDLSLLDTWYALLDVGADLMFYLTRVRIPRRLYIVGSTLFGGLLGALAVVFGRKVSGWLCPHLLEKRKLRRRVRPPPSLTRAAGNASPRRGFPASPRRR